MPWPTRTARLSRRSRLNRGTKGLRRDSQKSVEFARRRRRLKALGKKGKENQKVVKAKKAEHIGNGLTSCELRLSEHCTPFDNLDFSHSMKRRFMGKWGTSERAANMDESVVACRACHRIADEEMSHAEMLALHKRVIAERANRLTEAA